VAQPADSERHEAEILVYGGDHRGSLGHLVALDGDLARVRFPAGEAPRFGLGSAVEIGLLEEGRVGSARAPAVVAELPEAPSSAVYAFRVVASGAHAPQVIKRLIARSFESGRSSLVQPHPNHPVEVLIGLGEPGPWSRGELCDISLGGLSVYLETRSGPELSLGTALTVRLRLPAQADPLTVACRVHHVCQVGDRRHVGVSIEHGPDAEAPAIRAAILEYASERQLDMIRAAQT